MPALGHMIRVFAAATCVLAGTASAEPAVDATPLDADRQAAIDRDVLPKALPVITGVQG